MTQMFRESSVPSVDPTAETVPSLYAYRNGTDEAIEISYLHYLISGAAVNNTVIIVPANYGFLRLALNFNCRMRNIGVTNVLYWALDKSAAQALEGFRIPYYFNPSFFGTENEEDYHTENYLRMMAERPKFWRMIMRTGFNMLFLDVDIAVLTNPLLDIVGDADLEGQTDEFYISNATNPYFWPQMCGGAFFLRSNERSIQFLDRIERALIDGEQGTVDDQQAMNVVIRNHNFSRGLDRFEKQPNGDDIPIGGFTDEEDQRLTVRFIPLERYLNGHVWRRFVNTYRDGRFAFVDGSEERNVIREFEATLVHMNGWDPAKEWRMREHGWWYLNDDLTCSMEHVS
jgi:Nucleotide-diphospho-sugar transferase